MSTRRIHTNHQANAELKQVLSYLLGIISLILSFTVTAICQGVEDAEEITITLQVQHVGSVELPAIISAEQVYLPVKELFNFIKIRNIPSTDIDSISGFYLHQQSTFLIDAINSQITFREEPIALTATDIIKTEDNLYLKSSVFGHVFGLMCTFNFRNFTVTLTSPVELPVMRELRLEQMRLNLKKVKGERKADTTFERHYEKFRIGAADWSLSSSQQTNGFSSIRLNLALGGTIAGGETNVSMNYSSKTRLSAKQLFYQWRLVDNEKPLVKQLSLGKFYAQSISTIYSPVIGLQVTNAPTTSRRSFGTYLISRKTEPGWMVELYVNNVLVNAVKADASGFYSVEVPLVYGNSTITLHFYGPWGEERTYEENILIPFQLVPKKEFQYTISSGIVEDEKHSAYARFQSNYGLGSRITVGGGWEHLSSISHGKNIPFVTSAIRLGSRVLLSSEYAYGVRSKTILNYSLPSSLQLEVNYIKYDREQSAVRFNYLEERKFILSMPFKSKHLFTFSRLSFSQYLLPDQTYTSAEFLMSAVYRGLSSNLSNYVMYYDKYNPYIYSNLSFSFRTRNGYRISPRAQYEYTTGRFSTLKAELEKNVLKKGFISFAAENNYRSKIKSVSLGFRYDLSFGQGAFSAKQAGNITMLLQSARGSVIFDKNAGSFISNRVSNVGKGGIVVLPFLDLNANGKQDAGEPKVGGLNVHINGRNVQRSKQDTVIYITGLEANNRYLIELDPASFESISWQLKKHSMHITAEANQMLLLEVPVYVSGEVAGTVYMNGKRGLQGSSRVIVCIYNSEGMMVARTISEPDGYFNYLGLPPGAYIARIEAAQLEKLEMTSTPPISFTIKTSREGDLVDGLKFILSSLPK